MQIVSLGDNLHEFPSLFSGQKKKEKKRKFLLI